MTNSLHLRRQRFIKTIAIARCIGPLLFTVYINDVCKIFDADTKCTLYTDDVKLYSEIVAGDDHTRLPENLDALTRWSTDW